MKQTFKAKPNDIIINWGNSSDYAIELKPKEWLNKPEAVANAINKIKFLEIASKAGVSVPKWTKEVGEAKKWLKKYKVVARTLVESSAAKGIVLVDSGTELPGAKLYTRYVPKKVEYRVHVFLGVVFDVQQKKSRAEADDVDYQIRSYDNGWIFARDGVSCPKSVTTAALGAIKAIHLDFGAVDVGWTEKDDKATVYEINTAPGLEGETITNYAQKIKEVFYAQG